MRDLRCLQAARAVTLVCQNDKVESSRSVLYRCQHDCPGTTHYISLESVKLLAKNQFTPEGEASSAILCFWKLFSEESIQNRNYYLLATYFCTSGNPAGRQEVTRQQMLENKECCVEKLFLATLWEQLLILTVNFGNNTKVFGENFGC